LEQLRVSLKCLVADIAAGIVPFPEVLSLVDDDRTFLYVVKALEVVDGVGKVRARRMLEELGVPETARLADLSDAQRHVLIQQIQHIQQNQR
jgi:hypothetical protein